MIDRQLTHQLQKVARREKQLRLWRALAWCWLVITLAGVAVLLAPAQPWHRALVVPGICLLAGLTRMRPLVFAVLNISGTIARLILIRQVGEVFESPLQGVGGFIAEYRLQIFVISAIAVAWSVYNEFFSSEGEAHSLMELARDDEDGEEAAEPDELDVEDSVESDG